MEILINGLKKPIGGPSKGKINMSDWFYWTTFDVIGDLAFGELFDYLSDQNINLGWQHSCLISNPSCSSASRYVYPRCRDCSIFSFPTRRYKPGLVMKKSAVGKAERRIKTATTRRDFLYYISAYGNFKGGTTRGEIHKNAAAFVFAGSETTAASLNGATWSLLRSRDRLTRLNEKVRAAFKTRDEIDLQKTKDSESFHVVVTESFRIYPSALGGQPRQAGIDTVSGHWVLGCVSSLFSDSSILWPLCDLLLLPPPLTTERG